MATTKDRDTWRRPANQLAPRVAANVKINAGALVALTAAGLATPGATATTLTAAGVAEEPCDNTGGAAGAKRVTLSRGVFRFNNLGADAVTEADLLKDCFIVDDDTVAKTNGGATRSRAGKVIDVEAGGVWVEIA
jgi:hypothetical protein